jgi:hypothetical protein
MNLFIFESQIFSNFLVNQHFMKTLQKIIFILSIISFISCKKESDKKNVIEKERENIKSTKLLFKDYIKSFKPERLNLNADNIPEYIFCDMGHYVFFDGKTKMQIEYEYIVSKAGASGDLKVIDVNCNDNQKEFIVESAAGGTLGNYHNMDIMRYNSKTQKISSIFSCGISSFDWIEDKEKLDFVNYIDILYKSDNECVDTIKIYEGKFIGKIESYSLNIKQKKLIEKYYFNKQTGDFEKMSANSDLVQ